MIGWTWDSAAGGTALGGMVLGASRVRAREAVEAAMRAAGALSALVREVRCAPGCGDVPEPTGAAMIARAVRLPGAAAVVWWRDVTD